MSQKRTAVAIALIAAVIAMVGPTAATAASAASNSKALTPLTVAVGSAVPEYSPIYLAEQLGIYQKAGLQVTILSNVGPTAMNDVVGGQADVALWTPTTTISTRASGLDFKIIYNNAPFEGLSLVGAKGVTSLAQLKKMSNCRLGTTPAGTSAYYMSQIFVKQLGLHCTIVSSTSVPTLTAGLASGSFTAISALYPTALTVVQAGQGSLLVDSSTPAFAKKYLAHEFPQLITTSTTKVLTSKRASIVALLRGMNSAAQYIQTHTAKQVAAILVKQTAFAGTPVATLAAGLSYAKKFIPQGSQPGFITKADWNYGIKQYPSFGVPGLTATEPAAQYGSVIDMSYVKASYSK